MSYLKYKCELDLTDAVDWQRSNASILLNFLIAKTEWIAKNHCEFWNNWFDDIFNLDTANSFGLSVWSIILDEPVYGLIEPSPLDYPSWGFGEERENFGNGNFATNSDTGYNFTDEEIRIMLKLKSFILHMSGSVHGVDIIGINESLYRIFGENSIYCIDNRDMTFTYVLNDPDLVGLSIELYNRNLIPNPVGIGIKIVLDNTVSTFGFGQDRGNFGNNFYIGEIIGDI